MTIRFVRSFNMLIAFLLTASGAWGATVQTISCPVTPSSTCATGITGLVVGTTAYDVDFVFGSFDALNAGDNFPFVNDQSNAEIARDAINSALAGVSVYAINSLASVEFNYFGVSYATTPTEATMAQGLSGGGSWSITQSATFTRNGDGNYAVFSAVPIPAAAWLFGSALLGLGALKRKKA